MILYQFLGESTQRNDPWIRLFKSMVQNLSIFCYQEEAVLWHNEVFLLIWSPEALKNPVSYSMIFYSIHIIRTPKQVALSLPFVCLISGSLRRHRKKDFVLVFRFSSKIDVICFFLNKICYVSFTSLRYKFYKNIIKIVKRVGTNSGRHNITLNCPSIFKFMPKD